jgi:hypothetical protein
VPLTPVAHVSETPPTAVGVVLGLSNSRLEGINAKIRLIQRRG